MTTPDVPLLLRQVLLGGIMFSISCTLIGLVTLMLSPAQPVPEPTLGAYLASLRQGQPMGLLFLGLGILALTPLVGLLVQVIGFFFRREYLFFATALLVLIITLATFL